ncbi:hypothetical protein B0H19DRAFT_1351484 [Mycena capillaripes]|nr:hypothetical protein B0H19DRAFT_1351484 [Mycena capillaripes]
MLATLETSGGLWVGDEPTGLAAGWEEAEKTQCVTKLRTSEPNNYKAKLGENSKEILSHTDWPESTKMLSRLMARLVERALEELLEHQYPRPLWYPWAPHNGRIHHSDTDFLEIFAESMSSSSLRDPFAQTDSEIPLLQAERKIIPQKLSVVFPVLELPTGITSEIFVHCLPDVPSATIHDTDVALKTPGLWASFAFRDEAWDEEERAIGDSNAATERLFKWLHRAGASPLDLNITYNRPSEFPFPETIRRLFDHASQWRRVHLEVPHTGLVISLEELSLTVNRIPNPHSGHITMFATAPKLRVVSLRFGPLSRLILQAQLTGFTAGLDSEDALQVLHLCPALINYHLTYPDGNETERVLSPSLTSFPTPLLYFKSLSIDDPFHVRLLQYLTLPKLTNLSLPFYASSIIPFLSRSSLNDLRRLHIHGIDSNPGAYKLLRAVLKVVPTMSDIELEEVFVDEVADTLGHLCASPAAPHLQSIRFRIQADEEIFTHPRSPDYDFVLSSLRVLEKNVLRSFHMSFDIPGFDYRIVPRPLLYYSRTKQPQFCVCRT